VATSVIAIVPPVVRILARRGMGATNVAPAGSLSVPVVDLKAVSVLGAVTERVHGRTAAVRTGVLVMAAATVGAGNRSPMNGVLRAASTVVRVAATRTVRVAATRTVRVVPASAVVSTELDELTAAPGVLTELIVLRAPDVTEREGSGERSGLGSTVMIDAPPTTVVGAMGAAEIGRVAQNGLVQLVEDPTLDHGGLKVIASAGARVAALASTAEAIRPSPSACRGPSSVCLRAPLESRGRPSAGNARPMQPQRPPLAHQWAPVPSDARRFHRR
jgi:hypothetical protein